MPRARTGSNRPVLELIVMHRKEEGFLGLAPRTSASCPGAFLAVPLTVFVIGMLETFPETRWLASLMGAGAPVSGAPGVEADRTS
jgi:hypothetical protein